MVKLNHIHTTTNNLAPRNNASHFSVWVESAKVVQKVVAIIWWKTNDTLQIASILWINQHDFREKIIEIINFDKDIKKIEIPDNGKTKEVVNSIASENHPLIEVMRLIPGETVTNINFSGIKKLNDNLWQAFTDVLIEKFQEKIKNNFRKNTNVLNEKSRMIRTNYKNLTFSSPAIDAKKVFFEWKNKKDFTLDLIKELERDIEQISIKLGKSKDEVADLITNNVDFSVWESVLKNPADEKEKLKVFYEAEISSREWLWNPDLIVTKFDIENIKRHAQNAIEIEKEVLEKFRWIYFTFNDVKYKTVINDINWNSWINPILLRYVRKYSDAWLINPPELNELVNNYIAELNSRFDFISPSIDLERDLIIASRINEWIHKWTLYVDDLLYTYKWTLSKDSFFEVTKWKSGMNAFIDIKDMWIDNLYEFKLLWKKLIAWELSEDDLLKAWNKVTKKFIDTVNSLKEIYWDKIKISLGWDEIYLFIEWASKDEEKEILENLNKIMNRNHLKSRISHNFNSWSWIKQECFNRLDKLTSLNKRVEEKIESLVIENKMEHILHVPNNISLNIDKWLESFAINNLNDIINSILQKIDTKIFKFITSPLEWDNFDLWVIWETKIEFKWYKNSLMEININKI